MSHAAVPMAVPLGGDRWRIFFTTRDNANRSHLAFFEIDLRDPSHPQNISHRPVLGPGRRGTFDDAGAMGCWLIDVDAMTYLYYQGWNRGESVPFRNAIGLAVSDDGGRSFRKYAEGPILDRSIHDPFFTASPCVHVENGLWRMWYVSGTGWELDSGQPQPRYHIKYAESPDGLHWQGTGRVCIDFKNAEETVISRPYVLKEGGSYKMWYSYRGQRYRIGYAESADGLLWERRDEEAGIDVSATGWDAEMIEYPFIFDHKGTRYMLYNGNDYGKTGIGLAVLAGENVE